MRFNRGSDHVRFGRLLVTGCRQSPEAGWLDGASTDLTHEDGKVEHFGALVLHRPGSERGIALGWQNAHPPFPQRWRPGSLYHRVRWVLAGRPVMPPMTVGGETNATTADH